MASSPQPQNRRKNLDVKKLSSKREVTLLSGLDKFEVKFYGPKDTLYEGQREQLRKFWISKFIEIKLQEIYDQINFILNFLIALSKIKMEFGE